MHFYRIDNKPVYLRVHPLHSQNLLLVSKHIYKEANPISRETALFMVAMQSEKDIYVYRDVLFVLLPTFKNLAFQRPQDIHMENLECLSKHFGHERTLKAVSVPHGAFDISSAERKGRDTEEKGELAKRGIACC